MHLDTPKTRQRDNNYILNPTPNTIKLIYD